MANRSRVVVGLVFLFSFFLASAAIEAAKGGQPKTVTYDSRSLIINGSRQLFFSGSIHYTRMPVEMWQDIIDKAKEGGINLIQTYVFWNIHEPIQGQFNFTGNYDLVKFVRMIGESGLYVTLRVGPYVESEWNFGGFPYWLKEVPNITFRTYNEPFMYHMKKYCEMIIKMMEREKLFAPQGGPIILAQIENEYNTIQLAYKENGKKYVQWAADMATGLYNGVPWIMCKQKDAPSSVIATCNGRYCGQTWSGPNGPNKPRLWTENWTAQYRTFGDPPSQRAAEDIAYHVAYFFSKEGTLTNYYMYYGGTNYGRTSSSFVTSRYYDEAPLDEYGLKREPKWSHLKHLHRALRLSKKALLWGNRTTERVGELEITTFENPRKDICAAFLINNHTKTPATMKLKGVDYYVPQKSISILPDCKTVVFNSLLIAAQHNSRNILPSLKARNLQWEMWQERVPTANELPIKHSSPRELYVLNKDRTDYAWYSTVVHLDRRDLPMRADILPVLQIASLGHALVAFVNGEYVGFGHGNNIEKSFVFQRPVNLKTGSNEITVLAMTVGLPNSGVYMEKRFAGPRGVTLQGLMAGTLDLTFNGWHHEVGVVGEKLELFTEEGARKVQWKPSGNTQGGPLTWYKTYFDAPEGDKPVAINMESMAKGMVWVNGKSIGRYWSSFKSPIGKPTQLEYHIPRAFLKPKGNLLVVFEETGGNPGDIQIQTVNRDTICSIITQSTPPSVESWEFSGGKLRAVKEPKAGASLSCPDKRQVIKAVEFASFGNPDGACGGFAVGNCHAGNSKKVAEQLCLGKNRCFVPFEEGLFGGLGNECNNVEKSLIVQALCGK